MTKFNGDCSDANELLERGTRLPIALREQRRLSGRIKMVNVLHQYWHPIIWSKEVTDKPVSAKLLDQPLVLWRCNGTLAAFYDLCIHRGAPLSLGWIDGDRLVCAYHGWRYASDGRCAVIPSLPPKREIPAKARARAFHVQERHGLIWVCLGEPKKIFPSFRRRLTTRLLTGVRIRRRANGAPTRRG